jgi:hypothetical protein
MNYSALVYPKQTTINFTQPEIPQGYLYASFQSVSWNLLSDLEIDRTEFWANETGEYTLDQATELANSNASASFNSQKAKALLAETDWSEIPSVSASTSTPRLVNTQEYITYRVALREIAINPTAGYIAFPVKPSSVWA